MSVAVRSLPHTYINLQAWLPVCLKRLSQVLGLSASTQALSEPACAERPRDPLVFPINYYCTQI